MIMTMRNFVLLLVMIFSSNATASTASCALIGDHDTRMMCYATSTGSASWCGFIKDKDTKIRCYAATGR
jgi:hypothetical protein